METGGETAEMPGMYQSDDYDAVAAAVGAVSHGSKILPDLEGMVEGDVLLGLSVRSFFRPSLRWACAKHWIY